MTKLTRIVFVLGAASLFWFGVFELGTRVLLSRFGDPLDRARLVLEPDSRYLWRLRPDLDEEFEGARLKTNLSGFRIPSLPQGFLQGVPQGHSRPVADADWILLGPSSAFGWGVDESETYISQAAMTVKKTYANISQIGYGLSQGQRLMEDIRGQLSSKPRTVFIALGVNDVDRFRFFGPSGTSDQEAFSSPKTKDQLQIETWLFRWAFPAVFFRRIQESVFKFGCPPKTPLKTRTTIDDFIYDLKQLIRHIEFDKHQVIVIDSPSHYPFKIDPALAAQANADFEASAAAAQSGDCKKARTLFKSARRAEPHRVAYDIQNLNRSLKSASDRASWTLIEASGLLVVDSDFVDPIHFSNAGHRKLASMIDRAFAPKAPDGRSQ